MGRVDAVWPAASGFCKEEAGFEPLALVLKKFPLPLGVSDCWPMFVYLVLS